MKSTDANPATAGYSTGGANLAATVNPFGNNPSRRFAGHEEISLGFTHTGAF
jgi:hypothetical protein